MTVYGARVLCYDGISHKAIKHKAMDGACAVVMLSFMLSYGCNSCSSVACSSYMCVCAFVCMRMLCVMCVRLYEG